LAALISPLLAGLILLALPTKKIAFSPSAVLRGIPYRIGPGGEVTAMMPGGLVRFVNWEKLEAAATGSSMRTNPLEGTWRLSL
jgi:hypothetical protein